MAFAITAGTGTTISGDVYGTAHNVSSGEQTQFVAQAAGVLGALALATKANPAPVAQTVDWIQVTATVDTSIYASGDLLFDVATITSAALISGGSAELVCVSVLDEDDQGTAIDLYITNLSTTWGTINNAVNISDAVGRGIQAYIPIAAADFKDLGGCRFAQPRVAQSVGVVCETSGSANLYVVGVCASGTPTYTAAGIRINLGFKQSAAS